MMTLPFRPDTCHASTTLLPEETSEVYFLRPSKDDNHRPSSSKNEHRVAEGIEAIALANGDLIRALHQVFAHERGDEDE